MSERIITLFGEEIVPEQLKAVGKSRAKKKQEAPKEGTAEATEQVTHPPLPVAGKVEVKPEVPEIQEEEKGAVNQPVIENKADNASLPVTEAKPEIPEAKVEVPEVDPEGEIGEATAKKKEPKEKAAPKPENLPEDWKGENKYYSIGEVADLFKVKTSHIRFWTNEFKMKVRTTRKGDRMYTSEQIREIRAIHHLVKERGFTLTGARAKLKAQNNMDVETVDLKQSLLQLRNKLVAIKNQLR